MITLSNNHSFEYMAASGALAFDGKGWLWEKPLKPLGLFDPTLFTIVIKTLTMKPRRGNLRWYNPLGCIRFLPGGVVNAVGLTNNGIEWWCKKIGPKICKSGLNLIGSIQSDDIAELTSMAKMLDDFPLKGVELNASCPNVSCESMSKTFTVIKAATEIKKFTKHPILLKLSVMHDYVAIAQALEKVVEAISINSVPWKVVYGAKSSPLAHLGNGGVSGKPAQEKNWRMLEELSARTSIPVIGPSVWDYEDIKKVRELGAKAIGFGSVFLRYPWRPTLYVKNDRKNKNL